MRFWVPLLLAVALLGGTQFMLGRYQSSVERTHEVVGDVPLVHYAPHGPGSSGTVIVVYGFSSNKTMMWPWGDALARAGFATFVIDQPGHGQQSDGLLGDYSTSQDRLAENLVGLIDELVEQGRAIPGRIALVGHSMGGGAVTRTAIVDDRVAATVALSSAFGQPMPPDSPRNLLSLVADRDPSRMVQSVQAIAAQSAGGEAGLGQRFGDFADGTARESDVVKGRNHITILYDDQVMARTADWIHLAFGNEPPQAYTHQAPWHWVGIGLFGGLLLTLAVAWRMAPGAPSRRDQPSRTPPGLLATALTLVVAPLAAILACVYVRAPFLGVAVIDYLMPFFAFAAVALALVRTPVLAGAPRTLTTTGETWAPSLMKGATLFLALAATAGTVLHLHVSYLLPTPPRLLAMAVMLVTCWAWLVQEERVKQELAEGAGFLSALIVGLLGKGAIIGAFASASFLPNAPGFLMITIPVVVAVFLVLELVSAFLRGWGYAPAAVALFGALVLAWSMSVSFPLA